MIDYQRAAATLIATAAVESLWTLAVSAVAARQPFRGALLAVAFYLAATASTLLVVGDVEMLLPGAAGCGIGAYVAIWRAQGKR